MNQVEQYCTTHGIYYFGQCPKCSKPVTTTSYSIYYFENLTKTERIKRYYALVEEQKNEIDTLKGVIVKQSQALIDQGKIIADYADEKLKQLTVNNDKSTYGSHWQGFVTKRKKFDWQYIFSVIKISLLIAWVIVITYAVFFHNYKPIKQPIIHHEQGYGEWPTDMDTVDENHTDTTFSNGRW